MVKQKTLTKWKIFWKPITLNSLLQILQEDLFLQITYRTTGSKVILYLEAVSGSRLCLKNNSSWGTYVCWSHSDSHIKTLLQLVCAVRLSCRFIGIMDNRNNRKPRIDLLLTPVLIFAQALFNLKIINKDYVNSLEIPLSLLLKIALSHQTLSRALEAFNS